MNTKKSWIKKALGFVDKNIKKQEPKPVKLTPEEEQLKRDIYDYMYDYKYMNIKQLQRNIFFDRKPIVVPIHSKGKSIGLLDLSIGFIKSKSLDKLAVTVEDAITKAKKENPEFQNKYIKLSNFIKKIKEAKNKSVDSSITEQKSTDNELIDKAKNNGSIVNPEIDQKIYFDNQNKIKQIQEESDNFLMNDSSKNVNLELNNPVKSDAVSIISNKQELEEIKKEYQEVAKYLDNKSKDEISALQKQIKKPNLIKETIDKIGGRIIFKTCFEDQERVGLQVHNLRKRVTKFINDHPDHSIEQLQSIMGIDKKPKEYFKPLTQEEAKKHPLKNKIINLTNSSIPALSKAIDKAGTAVSRSLTHSSVPFKLLSTFVSKLHKIGLKHNRQNKVDLERKKYESTMTYVIPDDHILEMNQSQIDNINNSNLTFTAASPISKKNFNVVLSNPIKTDAIVISATENNWKQICKESQQLCSTPEVQAVCNQLNETSNNQEEISRNRKEL